MLPITRQVRNASAFVVRSALRSSVALVVPISFALLAGACSRPDHGATGSTTTATLTSSPPPAAASQSAGTVASSARTTASGSDVSTGETVESAVTDPGPNPTTFDPGPNPTTFDPGPNDTSGGPTTVRGLLLLDGATGCISIDSDTGRLDLRFTQGDYSLGDDGEPALVDVDGVAIAHAGDTLFVAGFDAGAPGACGARFDVESLVSVLPAG